MIETEEEKDQLQLALCSLWQLHNPKGPKLPIETQRAYLMALKDLEIDAVVSAIKSSMLVSTFFPKPVEIRSLAGRSLESQTQLAWGELNEAVYAYGTADQIAFTDPVLAATVRNMGGLAVIAGRTPSDLASYGYHQFKDIYAALSTSNVNANPKPFRAAGRIPIIEGVPTREPRLLVVGSGPSLIAQASSPTTIAMINSIEQHCRVSAP